MAAGFHRVPVVVKGERSMPFVLDEVESEETAPAPRAQRRVALVIGNGKYTHAARLPNPVRDAMAMAAVLDRLHFEVVSDTDLDLRKMGDLQARFEAKLRTKPDVAMLFYAGHGLQVRGKNYLIPVDAEISEMAHLSSRAILLNDVLEPMVEGAGASLIFLDACRDSPFSRNLTTTVGEMTARSTAIRGGLAKIDNLLGTFIAFATAPDMVAFDGTGANSPFTSAMLKHIETPGLSIADMMIDVRNAVATETGGRQIPWDQSSLRARFYFQPKAAAEWGVPELGAAVGEWAAVQNTNSIAVLTRFKERHPSPPWSEYADIRIGELRSRDESRRADVQAVTSVISEADVQGIGLAALGPKLALSRDREAADAPSATGQRAEPIFFQQPQPEVASIVFPATGAQPPGVLELEVPKLVLERFNEIAAQRHLERNGDASRYPAPGEGLLATSNLPIFDPALLEKSKRIIEPAAPAAQPKRSRARRWLIALGFLALIAAAGSGGYVFARDLIASELRNANSTIESARAALISALGSSSPVPGSVCGDLRSSQSNVLNLQGRWYSFVEADLLRSTMSVIQELKRQAKCVD
jgi:hypothetical protein